MRRLGALPAFVCAVVCAVVVVATWLARRPELTADDARRFTIEAFDAAGFRGVALPAATEGRTFRIGLDHEAPAWVTTAVVSDGTVELWVDRRRAQALKVVEDPEGLLTDRQFQVLDDYTRDPALRRRLQRNVAVTAAGILGGTGAVVIGASLAGRGATERASGLMNLRGRSSSSRSASPAEIRHSVSGAPPIGGRS